MSNNLKEIVRLIAFHKQMTVKEIAASIGYSRVHLQKELAKGDNPNLKRLLLEKYGEMIQDVSRETSGKIAENPGSDPKDEIIALQKQIIALQSKENHSLQKQIDVLRETTIEINEKVSGCSRLIQESNQLSKEANRLAAEGNSFLKQLEGLAELAKVAREQDPSERQDIPAFVKTGKRSRLSGK